MKTAIRIKGLQKSFPNSQGKALVVFENLDLEIEAHAITSIVGPSGCGKTTLLNALAGLEAVNGGTVEFEDSVNASSQPLIGYMFQRDRLLPWRTILQNALLGVEVVNGTRQDQIQDQVDEASQLLRQFGLGGFENAYPSELSEGMRQRVALVRTILIRPKILLLDEPFASIDYEVKLALENDLLSRVRKEKITTVFVSHDLEEAIVLGNRVVVLTPRPARVRRIYDIPITLESREALAARQTEEFRDYLVKLAREVLNPL